MKKYFMLALLAITVGFFMGKTFLEQYDGFDGVKFASSNGEILYFIKYGEYLSEEEMEQNTIQLENYIYNVVNGKYYVYIGITNNHDNLIKLTNYFSSLGYNVITEEYLVSNKMFLEGLKNYDSILLNTDDNLVISSIASQTLAMYEEYVLND